LADAAVAIADSTLAGTWNIADGTPLPMPDFFDLVADLARLPRPRRVAADSTELSPGLRGFLDEARVIDNRKLLSLPGFRLRHADPREGVRASLTALDREVPATPPTPAAPRRQ